MPATSAAPSPEDHNLSAAHLARDHDPLGRRAFLRAASGLGAATLAGAAPRAAAAADTDLRMATLNQPLTPAAGPIPATGVPLAPPDRQPPDLKIDAPPARKVGWAVVGLGTLALGQILPAFAECELGRPVALVSGHPDKARRVAALHGVDPRAIYGYEDYDRLAQNPEVDAIYVVLPNSMHAEFTIRGHRAGKHVLCQKPMASTVAECEAMIAAAREAGKTLGVAYRLHHDPTTLAARDLCRRRSIGEPRIFTSSHCHNVQAPNIRLSAALGGGAVGDLGVYSINAARHFLGEEPVEVTAHAHWPETDARFRETPESVSFILRFPSGVLALCDCSLGSASSSRFRVLGTKGYVDMEPGFAYGGLRLRVSEQGGEGGGQRLSELQVQPVNQFARQIDAFSRSVLEGVPYATPGEDGLADLRVVLAVHESVRAGRPVKL